MKIGIVIENYNLDEYDFLIGVEKGATYKEVDIAIGDFDSIDEKLIKSKKIIKFSPIKDDTDTALAVKEALKYSNDITIIGGIQGNRIEHLFANINLLVKYPFIKMVDKYSSIYVLDKNELIKYDDSYYSFYALQDSVLSLKGFKYPLNNYKLKMYDSLCVSNELLEDGIIEISGKILVIKSKKNA